VLSGEAANTNFIVFGLTRSGLEPQFWKIIHVIDSLLCTYVFDTFSPLTVTIPSQEKLFVVLQRKDPELFRTAYKFQIGGDSEVSKMSCFVWTHSRVCLNSVWLCLDLNWFCLPVNTFSTLSDYFWTHSWLCQNRFGQTVILEKFEMINFEKLYM
jgi:hypothetical protein